MYGLGPLLSHKNQRSNNRENKKAKREAKKSVKQALRTRAKDGKLNRKDIKKVAKTSGGLIGNRGLNKFINKFANRNDATVNKKSKRLVKKFNVGGNSGNQMGPTFGDKPKIELDKFGRPKSGSGLNPAFDRDPQRNLGGLKDRSLIPKQDPQISDPFKITSTDGAGQGPTLPTPAGGYEIGGGNGNGNDGNLKGEFKDIINDYEKDINPDDPRNRRYVLGIRSRKSRRGGNDVRNTFGRKGKRIQRLTNKSINI